MWTYLNPVAVYAGEGALSILKKLLAGKHYGIVTYDSPHFHNLCQQISAIVGRAPACIIDGVEENPSVEHLKRLCFKLSQVNDKPQVLIALGGGSVIDACKVLSGCAGDIENMKALVTGEKALASTIDYIGVPTTSGTGSEVTCWATVWDPENNKKYSLSDPSLYAKAAILEPELTLTLPHSTTISSALDALSHALESLWNVNRNPVSRMYAVNAAKIIIKHLPQLAADTENLKSREAIQNAALLAGLAFSNTRTAIAHSMSYAVTLEKGIAHGIACSFTLPAVLRANADDRFIQDCVDEIFGTCCLQAADVLESLLNFLDVAVKPVSYGYTEAEWMELIDRAAGHARGQNYSGNIDVLKACFNRMYQPEQGSVLHANV